MSHQMGPSPFLSQLSEISLIKGTWFCVTVPSNLFFFWLSSCYVTTNQAKITSRRMH